MPESGYESLTAGNRRKAREYIPEYDGVLGRFGPPSGIPKQKKKKLARFQKVSDTGYESLTSDARLKAQEYVPGYDWVPGRFGPPPGIPKQRKEQLDCMSDRDYMAVVLRMGQEEKESLMISEAERLRTYRSLWPNPPFLDYKDLAREGFYYTGVSDRVQCAFCAGFLGNWEKGDVPKQSHKNFFSYCKMAQRTCCNIPINGKGLPEETNLELLSTRADSVAVPRIKLQDYGINSNEPAHGRFGIQSSRRGTFKHYSSSHPMSPEELTEAGFFYEGPGDKVRCFWCDGALELWSDNDDTWIEHAKWYPGCAFVQQTKGMTFIRECRSQMSSEELEQSKDLQYNSCGFNILEEDSISDPDYTQYDTYSICAGLGLSQEHLRTAFEKNQCQDYRNVQDLLTALLALENEDQSKFEDVLQKQGRKLNTVDEEMDYDISQVDVDLPAVFDMEPFIKKPDMELNYLQAAAVVASMTCSICLKNRNGAAVIPCGHFCICVPCSQTKLPDKCCVCEKMVKAAIPGYLE